MLDLVGWQEIDLSLADAVGALPRTATPGGEDASWWTTLFHSAPYAIAIVDGQGLVVLVNRRLVDLVGYTPAQLIGHPLDEIALGKSTAGGPVFRIDGPQAAQQVCALRSRDGKPIWCRQTTVNHASAPGQPQWTICFLDELRALAEAFREIAGAVAQVGNQTAGAS